jgi:hypothetical protein
MDDSRIEIGAAFGAVAGRLASQGKLTRNSDVNLSM